MNDYFWVIRIYSLPTDHQPSLPVILGLLDVNVVHRSKHI